VPEVRGIGAGNYSLHKVLKQRALAKIRCVQSLQMKSANFGTLETNV
jgi:hypothetical protein